MRFTEGLLLGILLTLLLSRRPPRDQQHRPAVPLAVVRRLAAPSAN